MKSYMNNKALRWLEVVFNERFGGSWHLSPSSDGLLLRHRGLDGAILFDELEIGFTNTNSDLPCTWWNAEGEGFVSALGGSLPVPGVAKLAMQLIEVHEGTHIIHYDIPGLIYWMLVRIEEIGRLDLDKHDRFSAYSSHAYKFGYLDRPVVDEWLYVLGQVIKCQWPRLELTNHEFKMCVSHDVDQVSLYAFKSLSTVARMMAGDILKRRDVMGFMAAPYVKFMTKDHLINADPFNTFEWLMDQSEDNKIKSAFNFICGKTQEDKDADYEIEHPLMRNLLKRIHERGHEIGLHPSYNTLRNPFALKSEAKKLKRVCYEEGINQTVWGGRMHYLRWEHPTTLRGWEEAGMTYDSTLGYADLPGFRCGTCFEYPAYDHILNVQLAVRIRPLIVMECTIIDPIYMGLGVSDSAFEKMYRLKQVCKMVGGQFVLLWHNSYFRSKELKQLYLRIISQ
jgi:hypothetical protein